jgi:hypothetical protein
MGLLQSDFFPTPMNHKNEVINSGRCMTPASLMYPDIIHPSRLSKVNVSNVEERGPGLQRNPTATTGGLWEVQFSAGQPGRLLHFDSDL